MPIKVRPSEQTLLDTIGSEFNDINSNGLQVQPSTAYAATVYPISGYAASVPPASANETKVKDGAKGMMASLIRHTAPLLDSGETLSPSISFTGTATNLLVKVLSESLEVQRKVLISANFSAVSDSTNTRLDYWIDVNGVSTSVYKFFFNNATHHENISGSWVVTLPIGAVTITLKAIRGSGSGTLSLNSDDFVAITLAG